MTALSVNQLDEARAFFRATVGAETESWEKGLSLAPLGVAILGQLMVDTSSAPDLAIDKKAGPLMKHPNSLRGTVAQIIKEAYLAFNKAQCYTEQIQLYMEQAPRHVKECAKILKSQNAVDIKIVLSGRIECLREAADHSMKLSQQLAQCFHQLIELISQVLEASSASMDAAKEHQNCIPTRRLMASFTDPIGIKVLSAVTNEVARNYQPTFCFQNISTNSNSQVAQVRLMAAEVERRATRLKVIKGKEERNKNRMEIIYHQYVTNLEGGTNKKDEKVDSAVVQLLRQFFRNISALKGHWAEMARYFQSFSNIITTTTHQKLEDFTEEATYAAETPSLIQLMGNSILESSLSAYLTRRIADIYVKVSNLFLMRKLDDMQTMLTLKAEELGDAQKQLTESCQEVSEIISSLVKEESVQLIAQIQDHADQLKLEFDRLEISY